MQTSAINPKKGKEIKLKQINATNPYNRIYSWKLASTKDLRRKS